MGKQKPASHIAQTKQKWDGFRPVGYRLDLKVIDGIPINVIPERTDGGDRSVIPTTVFKAFAGLRDKQIKEVETGIGGDDPDSWHVVAVETDSGTERFSGSPFAVTLLERLVCLHKDGINPFEARWFFYDKDTEHDAGQWYTFFLVCDGKIVRERESIEEHPSDRDFNPAILAGPIQGLDRYDSLKAPAKREAELAFWYRKFYTETEAGQLMLLRPYGTILYHYEGPQARDTARAVQLLEINRLIWVAIPLLAAIAFPSIRDYMVGAEVVLGWVFLRVWWDTRKIGRS